MNGKFINKKRNISVFLLTLFCLLAIQTGESRAQEKEIFSEEQLQKARTLEDVAIGEKNAPVTIYEYASLTCSHCAAFHQKTFYKLKKKYIDSGAVRFIIREFPLDGIAQSYAVLARCAKKSKFFNIYDVLFSEQNKWVLADEPIKTFEIYAKRFGFDDDKIANCIKNSELIDAVYSSYDKATEILKVNSTPTFFVNGIKITGAASFEQISEIIEQQINEKMQKNES